MYQVRKKLDALKKQKEQHEPDLDVADGERFNAVRLSTQCRSWAGQCCEQLRRRANANVAMLPGFDRRVLERQEEEEREREERLREKRDRRVSGSHNVVRTFCCTHFMT